MASTFEVAAGKSALVTPKERPDVPSTLYLHNLDQQVCFHLELYFVFSPSEVPQEQDAVKLLEKSLAELLVPYYFVAGRYRLNEEEGRLEINCNGAGALFAGAEANISIQQLGDLTAPNPRFKKLLLYPNLSSIEEVPLLTVQVTKFSCGGFVVGICISHVLFDGLSLSRFFNDYASIAKGQASKVTRVNPDRSFLRPRTPPKISYEHNELVALPDIPARIFFKPKAFDQIHYPIPSGFCFKTFSFTRKSINSLKQKSLSDSIPACSSFEALVAHVWQSRTKAMQFESKETPSKLFIIMDTRKTFADTIPEGFVGNAIVAAPCTNVPSGQVSSSSLSFCVGKVQQTIRSNNKDYIHSQVDWCELNHGVINLPRAMLVTTWSRLGFDKVDFGWGNPAYMAPLVSNRTEYVIILPNCRGDGGVDVFMAMEFEQMNELEKHLLLY